MAFCAATYNVIAHKSNRPTISEGVRWIARQSGGTEIAGAILGGLFAHWLLKDGKQN